MINCPNCGGLNGNGNPTCSFCGAPLLNNSVDPNFNSGIQVPDNNFVEPAYDNQNMGDFAEQPVYNQDMNQQTFYAPVDDIPNDDILEDAYIKKNVDKIKAGGFSIWAFLFGGAYVWYRKMYKLLFVCIGISIIAGLVSTIFHLYYAAVIIPLAFDIFLGIP